MKTGSPLLKADTLKDFFKLLLKRNAVNQVEFEKLNAVVYTGSNIHDLQIVLEEILLGHQLENSDELSDAYREDVLKLLIDVSLKNRNFDIVKKLTNELYGGLK